MKILKFLVATALATAAFTASGSDAPKAASCDDCCADGACTTLVAAYEKVSTALAADDLAGAQAASATLACCLECSGHAELAAKVEAFGKAASLADARTAFKGISAAMIPLAEKAGECFIMTCPMAGADWIQTDKTVANPYYGSEMLRCGTVKKAVKANP